MVKDLEEQHFLECCQKNQTWNQLIATEREERLMQENEARQIQILKKVEAKQQRNQEINAMIDLKIKQVKEQSKTFITAANIDEAINNMFDIIVDHNIAIDLQGNFYPESKTVSDSEKTMEDAKETVPVL